MMPVASRILEVCAPIHANGATASEEAAETIQDHYLAGRKLEAVAAVPDELVDEVALCGPRERIADRLAAWDAIPNLILNVRTTSLGTLRTLAELAL